MEKAALRNRIAELENENKQLREVLIAIDSEIVLGSQLKELVDTVMNRYDDK